MLRLGLYRLMSLTVIICPFFCQAIVVVIALRYISYGYYFITTVAIISISNVCYSVGMDDRYLSVLRTFDKFHRLLIWQLPLRLADTEVLREEKQGRMASCPWMP